MIDHQMLIIIGSGPAGYSAAIYAARGGFAPLLFSGTQMGGQLTTTGDVENYPGFAQVIQGPFLMDQMRAQAISVGTRIIDDYVIKVDFSARPFTVWTSDLSSYTADSVIICTGAQAKWLGLPSEDKYRGFGVSTCATCDGFFYRGKKVVVVGGGNTAVEEALHLTHHASEVVLVHRRDKLRAENVLQQRLFDNPKVKVIWNSAVEEVLGSDDPLGVTGVQIKNLLTDETRRLDTHGVFIAIGHTPNTSLFKEYMELDDEGYIRTIFGSTKTNIPGVFAAGDVQDRIYRQAITAAGTGCMAALEAAKYLDTV